MQQVHHNLEYSFSHRALSCTTVSGEFTLLQRGCEVNLLSRERIDKMKRVKETRQAKIKDMEEKQKAMERKNQQKTDSGTQALQRKQQEERERAQLRDQKIQEAEDRRRREEEVRLKKLRQQEAEQKRAAEAFTRKKELEEAERQKKLASSFAEQQQKALKKLHEAGGNMSALQVPVNGSTDPAPVVKKPSIYESYVKSVSTTDTQSSSSNRPVLSSVPPSEKLNSTFTKYVCASLFHSVLHSLISVTSLGH